MRLIVTTLPSPVHLTYPFFPPIEGPLSFCKQTVLGVAELKSGDSRKLYNSKPVLLKGSM